MGQVAQISTTRSHKVTWHKKLYNQFCYKFYCHVTFQRRVNSVANFEYPVYMTLYVGGFCAVLASFVMQMKLITKLQNMKPCTAESHHVDVI